MADSSIPNINTPSRAAQEFSSVTLQSLASSTITSAAIFVFEIILLLLIRHKFAFLYHPRTIQVSDIDSLLSNLPSKVSDAYDRILSRSSDNVRARMLLQLIVATTRPLSLQEVNIALTLATQKGSYTSYRKLDLWPPDDFKSTIQNMCGLFVSVHDGKVSLIHQTAREFLVRNTELPELQSGKWQGYLDMSTAHCTMSQVCLDYLNFDDFASISEDQLDHNDCPQQGDKPYSLLDYAALNWATHYISQDSERAKDSYSAAKNLCNILLPQHSYWFKMYCDSTYLESKD